MVNMITEIYRGCADTYNWPHNGKNLDYSYDGCRYQEYGGWENTKVNAQHTSSILSLRRC